MEQKKKRADFSAYMPKKRKKAPVIERNIVLPKVKSVRPEKRVINIYLTEETIKALSLLTNRSAFIESAIVEKIERIHLKHKKALRDFPQSL
jgi:hypothetical protein